MAPNYRVLLEKANIENEQLRNLVKTQAELIKTWEDRSKLSEDATSKTRELADHFREQINVMEEVSDQQDKLIILLEELLQRQNAQILELGGEADDLTIIHEHVQSILNSH